MEIQKEIKKIDNKIVKLDAQLFDIQEQIFTNIKKMSQIVEDEMIIGNVSSQGEILAKLYKQKYSVNTKILKLNTDKMNLSKHLSKIEFN